MALLAAYYRGPILLFNCRQFPGAACFQFCRTATGDPILIATLALIISSVYSLYQFRVDLGPISSKELSRRDY